MSDVQSDMLGDRVTFERATVAVAFQIQKAWEANSNLIKRDQKEINRQCLHEDIVMTTKNGPG